MKQKPVELKPEVAIPMMLEMQLRYCLDNNDIPGYEAMLRGIQGVWQRLKPELLKKIEERNSRN